MSIIYKGEKIDAVLSAGIDVENDIELQEADIENDRKENKISFDVKTKDLKNSLDNLFNSESSTNLKVGDIICEREGRNDFEIVIILGENYNPEDSYVKLGEINAEDISKLQSIPESDESEKGLTLKISSSAAL